MNLQRCVLFAYNFLLLLYPPSFRRRFATEMLEIAEAAEPDEWPLIFGDTSLAIVRSWLEPGVPHSAAVTAGPDTYLALGESGLPTLRVVQGLVLAMAIVIGLCYVGSLGYLELPKCHAAAAESISR
jgi:hypothetical protein